MDDRRRARSYPGSQHMTDDEIERVADRVFEKMQAQIGKNAIRASIRASDDFVQAMQNYQQKSDDQRQPS